MGRSVGGTGASPSVRVAYPHAPSRYKGKKEAAAVPDPYGRGPILGSALWGLRPWAPV